MIRFEDDYILWCGPENPPYDRKMKDDEMVVVRAKEDPKTDEGEENYVLEYHPDVEAFFLKVGGHEHYIPQTLLDKLRFLSDWENGGKGAPL